MKLSKQLTIMLGMILICGAPTFAAVGNPAPAKTRLTSQSQPQIAIKNHLARYRAREIIVKYKTGTAETAIQKLNSQFGASVLARDGKRNLRRMRTPSGSSVESMLALYRANANVAYAEPNYLVQATMTPNDSYYSYQWNLYNPTYGGINMESAWDVETGGSDVIVAVLDTGVAYETYGATYKQASDLAGTTFVQGYDFINEDSHPNDDNGHGTHVTGTIAQSTNNSTGAAGVAFGVSVMPVKVLDADGSGTHADVAEGIIYAADHGAKVINLSLGSSDASNTMREAVAYAYNKGVTIVAASGNDGATAVGYPAAYDDYVIAVGATRYDETRAYYSNGGASLDLMAPGGDLTVDQNGDGYGDGILQQTFDDDPLELGYWFYSGTSMATPHVAGVAALILSRNDYDPAQVREALEQTAEDKGNVGWDTSYGWGLVDATAALAYSSADIHEVGIGSVSAAASAVIGQTLPIALTLKNSGNYAETITVGITETTTQTSLGSQNVTLAAHSSTTATFSWTTTGLAARNYTFTAGLSGVTDDSNANNNQKSFSISLAEPLHDVVVSAFTASSTASQGTTLSLPVVLKNAGNSSETLVFTLTDGASGVILASKTLTLAAGGTTTVSTSWNTGTATVGAHQLTARLQAVAGEANVANNVVQKTVTITKPALKIELSLLQAKNLSKTYSITAYVRNKETTTKTIILACKLNDKSGKAISDSGLANQKITLRSGYLGSVTWTGNTRLARGTYTATVTISEANQIKSVALQVK